MADEPDEKTDTVERPVSRKHVDDLTAYMRQVQKFPFLEPEEEFTLARKWRDKQDQDAARKLISSHLRLVARIASGYRGYGMPIEDLIAEGSIGMMQALNRFDPDKGFRLSTYASWWIKAAIKDYVMKSWSLVRTGTTAAQKKLFFKLRGTKNKMQFLEGGGLTSDQAAEIAKKLDVTVKEVLDMDQRMSGPDYSLNAPSKEDSSTQWEDWLEEESDDQEINLIQQDELRKRKALFQEALTYLNPREYEILKDRRLVDDPITLSDIGEKHNISRERVRQIEMKAFEKLQHVIRQKAAELRLDS